MRLNPLSTLIGVASILIFIMENKSMASVDDGFTKYDSLIRKYSKIYGVPWRWAKAIAIVESNLGNARSVKAGIVNPTDAEKSKSSDGKSWGIMQTILETARRHAGMMASPAWLNVPENSIMVGIAELQRLIKIFGLDPEKVSRAYNGGPGYAKTAMGPSLTLLYYAKFKSALATVMDRQPGNVLET